MEILRDPITNLLYLKSISDELMNYYKNSFINSGIDGDIYLYIKAYIMYINENEDIPSLTFYGFLTLHTSDIDIYLNEIKRLIRKEKLKKIFKES
jgi:hypothetical protein